jgi:hypothetical protein
MNAALLPGSFVTSDMLFIPQISPAGHIRFAAAKLTRKD